MQQSLLHRLKNKICEAETSYTPDTDYQSSVNALFIDLRLLFSSRPLLSKNDSHSILEKSVLNYGIRVVEYSNTQGNREKMTFNIEKNIIKALGLYERRLSDIMIKRYSITAEKISFRVDCAFNGRALSFIIAWETGVSSYSLETIL